METLSELQRRMLSQGDIRLWTIGELKGLLNKKLFEIKGERVRFRGRPAQLRAAVDILIFIAASEGIDMGVAVRRKYRNKCPRCLKLPCTCWNAEMKPCYHRPRRLHAKARSLDELQTMFARIFPVGRHTLTEILSHLSRELQELKEAKLKRDKEEELADAFAWFMQVANTLGVNLAKSLA